MKNSVESAFCEYTRDSGDDIYFSPRKQNECAAHFHRQIEIYYLHSGSAEITIGGETRMLKPNESAFSDSYDVHRYVSPSASSTVLIIPYRRLSEFMRYKAHRSFGSNFLTDPAANRGLLGFLKLVETYRNAHPLLLSGVFNAILGLFLESLPLSESRESKDQDFSRRILFYFEEHLTEEITLSSLAFHFGYSESHFSKLFHDCLHSNLNAYVNSLRVRYAQKLIEEGMPVLDAAFDAGFSSLSTFYRCYQKFFGKKPTQK